MTTLRARPTIYNGIQMRSRLEAAYAQTLDLDPFVEEWAYEPYAFASVEGQYLPDFLVKWLWGTGCVEIKPENADLEAALSRMHIIHASEPDALLRVATRIGDSPFFYPLECWAERLPCGLCHLNRCEKCSSQDVVARPVRIEAWGPQQDYECRDCGWMVTMPVSSGGYPPFYHAAPTT